VINWRAIGWWLLFTLIWIALFSEVLTKLPWLVAVGSMVLGYLSLCVMDVVVAMRHKRRLHDEYVRKHARPGELGTKRFEAGDESP
jgi:hypothetical protein